jgi:predicted amidohydrolase YtcJ
MKNILLMLSFVTLLVPGSCTKKTRADMIIINGKVFTNDPDNPWTEALAIKDEIIIAAGSTADISAMAEEGKTKIIDAAGRLVLPGFNDAHLHFGPVDPDYVELRYTTDPSVITEKVREQVEKSKPGQLIMGGHWEHEMFTSRAWPSKELIDKVSPDNPVILSRTDGHSVLVNSYVLKASGITKNTPDPFGGEIVRDPVSGEPTGILKETAESLIKTGEVKIERTDKELKEYERKGYLKALQQARELGVTSIQNAGGADFQAYADLLQSGELTLRIDIGAPITDDTTKLTSYKELQSSYPASGNWVRFGYLKGFIDGTIGSATALMFEPFADNTSSAGLSMMPYEQLENAVVEADRMGFQIGIHAIGDKGNNWVLNAYEKARKVNGKRDSRHRIEHAQVLALNDIPRFASLDVIPSMQPTHCITDKRFCEKRIGTERSKGAYAWNSLQKTGARLAFGTDYSVEPLNPMEGLYAAVTRKDRLGEEGNGWFREEKISMEEAVRYYTLGAAYAQFMEDRKGIFREGYLADIIITDRDLFSIPENQIMKTRIDCTITGGKVVYERQK